MILLQWLPLNSHQLMFIIVCLLGVCIDTNVIYQSVLEKKDILVIRTAKEVTS